MNKGIFITGTDTGVGKTRVAMGLLAAFRSRGLDVCPMKPVETGCTVKKGKLVPADAVKLIEAAEAGESIDIVNPFRFRHPLAPAAASEREGPIINRKKIISACNKLLSSHDVTIVEGAGGVMVPVYKRYLLLDLIEDLDLPVIIISRAGLGTINHTLLTVHALKSRRVDVLGVITNDSTGAGKDVSSKSNPGMIEKLGGIPVLGHIPYARDGVSMDTTRGRFSKIADRILPVL